MLALFPACAWLGANPARNQWQSGLPGTRIPLSVVDVKARHQVLDVLLSGGGLRLHTFLPANERCARIVASEARVDWVAGGAYGSLEREDERCDAVGIGSLSQWRDRRPSGGGAGSPVPRSQATFREVHRDGDVIFLRGRFPLASRVGWVGLGDTLALVPRTALCESAIEDGVASLEFYPRGQNVLALLANRGRCPIEGLIQPQ